MRIFISGPYSAPTERVREHHMRFAAWIGARIMEKGHIPFVPHLMHVVDNEASKVGIQFTGEDWMEYCTVWLRACDALYSIGPSKGADIQLALAKDLGMPIYYNLPQVPSERFAPQSDPNEIQVEITRLPHACDEFPIYQTEGAAGLDLRATIPAWPEGTILRCGQVTMVPTGIRVAIPRGYVGMVVPRSGLSRNHQVALANSPGIIDSDFRGELFLAMTNDGSAHYRVHHGDRLAQLLIVPVARAVWKEVPELPTTERGSGGWGSTGVC